ncbi:hypothetical protein ABZV80_33220 [Streptomyces sp. NPDC005132]|uniref:hypothetical protein n=1 Tax=Streptomyces sp. NPDC005132 TaxID=3154294 RepID=UPI0033AC3B3D
MAILGGQAESSVGGVVEHTVRRELAEEAGFELADLTPFATAYASNDTGATVPISIYAARWNGDPREPRLFDARTTGASDQQMRQAEKSQPGKARRVREALSCISRHRSDVVTARLRVLAGVGVSLTEAHDWSRCWRPPRWPGRTPRSGDA